MRKWVIRCRLPGLAVCGGALTLLIKFVTRREFWLSLPGSVPDDTIDFKNITAMTSLGLDDGILRGWDE